MEVYCQDRDLTVRSMAEKDCQAFANGFAAQGWEDKDLAQYERYLKEQKNGERKVIVGEWRGKTAGYVTLLPRAGAGFGRELFEKAVESALALGAEKLYISAHSSVESQACYKRVGCAEAEECDPRHAELEPCDCQLEYKL